MANFQELYAKLLDDLYAEKKGHGTIFQRIDRSISLSEKALQLLVEVIPDHEFAGKRSEIQFYKEILPSFQSHVIFYRRIFQIEVARPPGSREEQESYLRRELEKVQEFFTDHKFIYQYLRSGLETLDEKLFFKPKDDSAVGLRLYSIDEEPFFPTSFGVLVARVKANDLLVGYLNEAIDDLRDTGPDARTYRPTLHWTDSKTSLIELAYALQAAGVFNEGKTELREVIEGLQNAFQVDLGNYPRTFQEILYRKTGYTSFIERLRDKLLLRIQSIEAKHVK